MNNIVYPNINSTRNWRNPTIRHDILDTQDSRLIPFLTGAVISAPFWWATSPRARVPFAYPYPAPLPFPYPYPIPYPRYGRYPRRRFYGYGSGQVTLF